jgi:enoyl-CoA hydratase/carnithine racemase
MAGGAGGLTVEREGHTLRVTIARGDDNRFSPAMIERLAREVAGASGDPDLRFVRIRARGPAFCLGRDAAPRPPAAAPPPAVVRHTAAAIAGLNELLQTTPLVVVCEVHADAAGFGAGLVGNADVAVAAESARFSFPEIKAGYAPAIVMSWLPRVVPRRRAFEMVTTGAWVDAATAARDGLVSEAVPDAALEARVDERIAELAALDAGALRDVKTFLTRTRAMDQATAAAASVDSLVVAVVASQEVPR